MSIRKMLPVMMVALALLAASAAFAADAPPVPTSKEDFLSSLQTPADPAPSDQDGTALPEVDGVPAPQMKHASPGSTCTYLGVQCRTCSGGYTACDVYRCSYQGNLHNHYYCSGVCSNPCAI